ncbi:hypothetical protein V2G26_015898 [Clonostachys chloroleuca]
MLVCILVAKLDPWRGAAITSSFVNLSTSTSNQSTGQISSDICQETNDSGGSQRKIPTYSIFSLDFGLESSKTERFLLGSSPLFLQYYVSSQYSTHNWYAASPWPHKAQRTQKATSTELLWKPIT